MTNQLSRGAPAEAYIESAELARLLLDFRSGLRFRWSHDGFLPVRLSMAFKPPSETEDVWTFNAFATRSSPEWRTLVRP